MARIPVRSGFTIMPEGWYVFRIYDVQYDEKYGKLEVHLVNAKGQTMIERFSLIGNDGQWNEGALNAFGYFCHVAIADFSREDIDPEELINHYIRAEVVHNEAINKKGKMSTFANLGDKESADGFDEEPTEAALSMGRKNKPAANTSSAGRVSSSDLDALLD